MNNINTLLKYRVSGYNRFGRMIASVAVLAPDKVAAEVKAHASELDLAKADSIRIELVGRV